LNREEATLTTEFQSRLLEANKAASIMVEDVAQLDGLSPEEIASAAQLATERGTPDRWALAIQNTTQQPALAFLRDRALRCRLFEASVHRADRDGPVDTRGRRSGRLRASAALLGYENAAATCSTIRWRRRFRRRCAPSSGRQHAAAKARHDRQAQSMIDAAGGASFARGIGSYAERRESRVRAGRIPNQTYFELDWCCAVACLRRESLVRTDWSARIPVYHQVRVRRSMRTVALALFYADFFKRANKVGGAWMDMFADQSRLLNSRAIVTTSPN
jgi:peptidyl-dipeptidase Dcp